MKKLRVVLRWTGKTLLVLLAILALFILEENVRGRIMLSRYKAELRAKGEKLTLEELNLPKLPKEGNGATELLAAADELTMLSNRNPVQPYGLEGMKFVAPGRVVVLHRQERLHGSRSEVPALRGLQRRPSVDDDLNEEGETPIWSWSDLAAEIASARPTLMKAKHALLQPTLGVELNYADGIMDLNLPHLKQVRTVAHWFTAAAFTELHDTDLNGAVDDLAAIAALTKFTKPERMLISQLVRMRIGDTGLQATWEALQMDGWTEPQLRRLQAVWESVEVLPQLLATMEAERVFMEQLFNTATRWPKLKDLREGFWYTDDMSLWWNIRTTSHDVTWRLAWVAHDRLRLLQRWQQAIEIERQTVANRSWVSTRPRWEQIEDEYFQRNLNFYDGCRYLLSGTFGPVGWNSATRRFMRFETQRQMTLAAVALKRYELARAHFPESLEELIPQYLSEVPRDYLDDKPLRYRRASESFALYSVGENGVDDGGDPTPDPPLHTFGLWQGLDAVWPAPATREEVEAWEVRRLQRMRQGSGSER